MSGNSIGSNQAAIQAAIAVKMASTGLDIGSHLAPVQQKHGRPALEKSSFNWNAQDRQLELLNFDIKVVNIMKSEAYELTDEVKVLVIKN